MKLITLDFETYYDTTYSLTKCTTESYIRDDQFEVIGVSVKVDDAPAQWFSGDHAQTKQWLDQFPWADAMAVAHNTMFDGAILSWRFGIRPKVLADTLSMARALHGINVGGSLAKLAEYYELGVKGEEVIHAKGKRRYDFAPDELARYGAYCVNDTELTYKLFHKMAETFPKGELRIIDLTLRMFTEPVLDLDAFLLEKHLSEVKARKEELLVKAAGSTDAEEARKNIMSNAKFAELLQEFGVEPPTKISARTNKETFAFAKTDEAMKALLEHEDERVQALVAARLGIKSTLEETRTERFLDIARRGALPIPLKYFAAHTSRWGGTDKINLQNLPSRGPNAKALKKAIRAPRGYVIIDSDSSQIEARMLAWVAGQEDLVDIFRNNNQEILDGVPKQEHKYDPYKIMASAIYDKEPHAITDAERFVGKSAILGCGYGMGAKKFQASLKTFGTDPGLDMCRHIVDTYRFTYAQVPALWDMGDRCLAALIDGTAAKYGVAGQVETAWHRVNTPLGVPIQYTGLRRARQANGNDGFIYNSRSGITGIWGGKFTENIIQHLARVVIGQQMLKIARRYRVVLTVHDAIACIAPADEAEEARAYVEQCMRWVPDWASGLPVSCESGVGNNYGEC